MKNVIISDFDETITSRDTICLLGELPYILNPSLQPKWMHFQKTYLSNYVKFQSDPKSFDVQSDIERSLPLLSAADNVINEDNFEELFKIEIQYQKNRRLLELSSTREMQRYNLFKDVKHSDVTNYVDTSFQGSSSLLREGFKDFLLSSSFSEFYVLSINWSREFILEVIGREFIDVSKIFCNELISHNKTYTGKFSNTVMTGSDKLKKLEQLLEQYENHGKNERFWYIGDSDTDILSMLHPRVNGLLLIDPETEKKKFTKLTSDVLGISSEIATSFGEDVEKKFIRCIEKEGGNGLYIAKSWSAIEDLIKIT